MLDSLLAHAVEAYQEILQSSRPADALLSGYLRKRKYLGARDRKFVAETIYGALRQHLWLDALAEKFLSEQGLPQKFRAVFILVFFLLEQDVAEIASLLSALQKRYAFRSETLERIAAFWTEHRALPEDNRPESLARRYAFPLWMTERLLETMSPESVGALYAAMNAPAPIALRVNAMKTTREELQKKLQSEGVDVREGRLSPDALYCEGRRNVMQTEAFKQGLFEIQDEGSQLISPLLNPKPNQKILDACAGGGGKTLHIATLMRGQGKVFAFEKYESRFGNIRERIRRSGLQNIEVVSSERFERFEKDFGGKLDAMLIDAPCTGSGTLRRNPDLKLRLSEDALRKMAQTQIEILSRYAPLLKKGGALVYATCSIFEDENERVVEAFLDQHSEFELVKPEAQLKACGETQRLSALIARIQGAHYLKLLPHQDGTDGFFAAILTKT